MKILPLMFSLVAVALAQTSLAQAEAPTPGYYQYKSTTMLAGRKAGQLGPVSRCITKQDIDDPERIFNVTVEHAKSADTGCVVQHVQRDSRRISYDIECGDRRVHVDGRFSENTINAVRSDRPKSSTTPSTVTAVAGKRMGDCAK